MHFFLHGWYAEIMVCYQRWNKNYTIWDIKMKLIHKLFHKMINRSWKFQGCSLIYVGMANYSDVPVLSLTVGKCIFLKVFLCWRTLKSYQFFIKVARNTIDSIVSHIYFLKYISRNTLKKWLGQKIVI